MFSIRKVNFQKNELIICDFIYIFKMSFFLAHPVYTLNDQHVINN